MYSGQVKLIPSFCWSNQATCQGETSNLKIANNLPTIRPDLDVLHSGWNFLSGQKLILWQPPLRKSGSPEKHHMAAAWSLSKHRLSKEEKRSDEIQIKTLLLQCRVLCLLELGRLIKPLRPSIPRSMMMPLQTWPETMERLGQRSKGTMQESKCRQISRRACFWLPGA